MNWTSFGNGLAMGLLGFLVVVGGGYILFLIFHKDYH